MVEYRFYSISVEYGTGYSLAGGLRSGTTSHRDVIENEAKNGWRYVGFIPTSQRGTGQIEAMDLIFEREVKQ